MNKDIEEVEEPYTVPRKIVNVEGDTGRPEVFVQVRREGAESGVGVTLMRDVDAQWLHRELGEYLDREGYDVE